MRIDPEEIEHLMALKRTARSARSALDHEVPERAATVDFPVAVYAPGSRAGRNDHFWSFGVSHEPGSVFPVGVTAVRYRGTIGGTRFAGRFHVVVGDHVGMVPAAGLEADPGHRTPAWARSLPANQWVPPLEHRDLVRSLRRAAGRDRFATERLMASIYPFLEHLAGSFTAQLKHRQAFLDRDDIISEGWKRAYQLLDTFTGPDRPSVPWSTAVYRSCRRDMGRAVHALDGMSEAVAMVRAACSTRPDITDPIVMQRFLAVQAEQRRLETQRADLSPTQRQRLAEATDRPSPFSLRQVAWAMEAPRIVSWHDRASGHDPDGEPGAGDAQLLHLRAGCEDAGLAAVDAPAASAARGLALVSGTDPGAMLDVMTDLGVDQRGDAEAARLPQLRRRVLAPFILPGETATSEAVLRRAGQRARTKLFAHGELLGGPHLAAAWRAGITPEEARAVDAELAG